MSPEALGWYASIFFWLFFTGLGIPPCPEEAGILYAAGLTALHPELHWWIAWPLTSAGVFCADLVLYALGRFWGHRLVGMRWAHWLLSPERRQRLERRFHEHGVKLLIAARLLPPVRTGVFLIAGTIHYSFVRFVAADGIFAVIGVGVLFFCSTWLIELIHQVGSSVLWAAVPIALLYALYRYYRYLRSREMRGEPVPPVSVLDLPLAPQAQEEVVADPTRLPGSSP